MAVSSNYSWTQTRDQIATAAYRLAGLKTAGRSPSADELSAANDYINASLKALENDGIRLRNVARVNQTLTSGTASYSAADDTIDVEFPVYLTYTNGSSTTTVQPMTRDEYMALTNKTDQGVPSRLYIEKASTGTTPNLTLILWPVPDSTVTTLSYARVRLIRDLDSGTNPDLGPNWIKFLTYELAHDLCLANSLPLPRAQYFKGLATQEKNRAQQDDTERGDVQFVVSHRGGWY